MTNPADRPAMKPSRDLAILVLVVAIAALPFLGQPFHMDDNFYMDMARNALKKPLFPNDTPYVFEGGYMADMGSHSHPPLQTYFLACLQRLVGEGPGKEASYHLAALIYPLLSVISFYFLSVFFLQRPFWPALAFACCPLFMVMQHNLMTDVPSISFWLAAIACFMHASARRKKLLFAGSAVLQFAAMFTSYQSLALTPLLGYWQVCKKGSRAGWIALALPPVLLAGWFAMNYAHYGRFLLHDTVNWLGERAPATMTALATKMGAWLVNQGWLVVFPFFILYLWASRLRKRLLPLAAVGALWLVQFVIPDYSIVGKLIFAVGLVSGLCLTAWAVQAASDSFRRRGSTAWFPPVESRFLGLWYFGVAFYCLVIFTNGSARYILPLVPPLLIVIFRFLEVREVGEYRLGSVPLSSSASVATGMVIFSLGWGLLLSHADLEFARLYPRAAAEYARVAAGMKGYFGGEWGFRYYMGRAGFDQLPNDESSVEGGSWVAKPRLALGYDVPGVLASMMVPAANVDLTPSTPLRLLDGKVHAGFYSSHWGLLPFGFSTAPLEEINFAQVNFLVERLPWARVEGEAPVRPWPGYLQIEGRAPMALIMLPTTRISYAWRSTAPVTFEAECALDPKNRESAPGSIFRLSIVQRGAGGRELAAWRREWVSGDAVENWKWQSVRLPLQPSDGQETWLEFSYECSAGAAVGRAALALPVFRRH